MRVNITANTGWAAAQLSELEVYGAATSSSNLALGKATSESGHSDVYGAGNVGRRQPGHLLGEHQQLVPASGSRSTSAPRVASTGSC